MIIMILVIINQSNIETDIDNNNNTTTTTTTTTTTNNNNNNFRTILMKHWKSSAL